MSEVSAEEMIRVEAMLPLKAPMISAAMGPDGWLMKRQRENWADLVDRLREGTHAQQDAMAVLRDDFRQASNDLFELCQAVRSILPEWDKKTQAMREVVCGRCFNHLCWLRVSAWYDESRNWVKPTSIRLDTGEDGCNSCHGLDFGQVAESRYDALAKGPW